MSLPPNVWSEMTTCDEMNLFAWQVVTNGVLRDFSQPVYGKSAWRQTYQVSIASKGKKANDCLAVMSGRHFDLGKWLRKARKRNSLRCWLLLLLIAFICAILRSRVDSLRSHVSLPEWLVFIAQFWISTEVVYLQRWHGWCHMKLLPSRRVLCTPYNHAPCHFMRSQIRKVHACLSVTCHLHFWQNGRDLLRATAVTWGGGTDTEIRVTTESWSWRRKFSRRSRNVDDSS